jgi:hypothetical protein
MTLKTSIVLERLVTVSYETKEENMSFRNRLTWKCWRCWLYLFLLLACLLSLLYVTLGSYFEYVWYYGGGYY